MKEVDEETSARFANMSFCCAVLVVGIHIGTICLKGTGMWWMMGIVNGILRLAVPYFFFTSGYFVAVSYANGRTYSEQLVRRVQSLLVPYLIWNTIWLTFMWCATGHLQVRSVVELLDAYGLDIFKGTAMGVLWFVRLLMLLIVVSPLIYKLSRMGKLNWILCPAVAVLAGVVTMFGAKDEGWFVFTAYRICPEGMFCFYFGMVLSRCPLVNMLESLKIGLFFAGLACIVGHSVCDYFGQHLLGYWFGWSGLLILMMGGLLLMPKRRFNRILLSATFPLYLIHPFVVTIVAGLVSASKHRDALLSSPCFYFLRWAIVVCVVVVGVNLMRRIMPRLSNVMFGGR